MRRARFILVPLVLLLLAVGIVSLVAGRRGSERQLLGSGIIEADEVNVGAQIGGRLVEVLVEEGEEVSAGQVIARLEHDDIDAECDRAAAAARAAEALLRELERGSRPEQIAASRAAVAEAEAGLAGAIRQQRTAEENHRKATELKQQLDAARGRAGIAQAAVEQARAKLQEAERGPTDEEIEVLRATLRAAETHVESTRIAARDAEEVYKHQSTLETPLVAAATEATALQAGMALAQGELARTRTLAGEDAATGQALDRAQAEHDVTAARLDGATKATADARTQVALTRAQAAQLRDAALSRLEEALKARDTAKARLDAALAGTREERIQAARAAVAAAQAEADTAGANLTNAETLYQDRLQARRDRDATAAAADQAEARLSAARANLALVLAGSTDEAIAAARARLDEAQAALQAAEVRRGYCDVVSPCRATVTEVVMEPGEMAQPGGTVCVLADLSNVWLRAYLGFSTLGSITLGQELRVVTEAVPGRVFSGRTIRIADEAEFTPRDVQTAEQRMTQVYWIKVALGNTDGLLKPGMPADVLPPEAPTR